jgi:hypothetical protein
LDAEGYVHFDPANATKILVKDALMSSGNGHGHHENTPPVTITDKRGQRYKGASRESEPLPISELGSKAVYQVYAQRFTAVTPAK